MLEDAAVLTDQGRRTFQLGPRLLARSPSTLAVPQVSLPWHVLRPVFLLPLLLLLLLLQMMMFSLHLRRSLCVGRCFRCTILFRVLHVRYRLI